MSKKNTVLIGAVLLFTLPTLAIIRSNTYKFGWTLSSEKCSLNIEDLKLCTENSEIIVNSGEPVEIKLSWVNLSNMERRIGTRSSGYSVTINDEKGEKLIPIFQQRQMEREKRLVADPQSKMTTEDIKELGRRIRGGSDRGIYIEANETEDDEVKLTEIMYDYDLTKKGKYKVTISKIVASLEKGKTIEFVLNDIEIEIK